MSKITYAHQAKHMNGKQIRRMEEKNYKIHLGLKHDWNWISQTEARNKHRVNKYLPDFRTLKKI